MLHSAIDPALLIYKQEDWQNRASHCFSRFGALMLHRRLMRQYNQRIVFTDEYASKVQLAFPWAYASRDIEELRDLRRFILEDLGSAQYVDCEATNQATLEPNDLTCKFVDDPEVLDIWKQLLLCCLSEMEHSEFDVQVATWQEGHESSQTQFLAIAADNEAHHLPLVWNEGTWAKQLASQNAWPDLQMCVELYFMSNPGMSNHPMARQHPTPFGYTEAFLKNVADTGQAHLQQAVVKAITKLVYGILDSGLHDEPYDDMRRIRVTDFWRVHYIEQGGSLRLEKFGRHDMA